MRARFASLDNREARTLYGLTRNPRLWAFMFLASMVGLEAAVEACVTRLIPAAAIEPLMALHYDSRNLPTGPDARAIVLAARVLPRWTDKKNRPGRGAFLVTVAADLGVTVADAEAAVAVARRFGWMEGEAWRVLPTL